MLDCVLELEQEERIKEYRKRLVAGIPFFSKPVQVREFTEEEIQSAILRRSQELEKRRNEANKRQEAIDASIKKREEWLRGRAARCQDYRGKVLGMYRMVQELEHADPKWRRFRGTCVKCGAERDARVTLFKLLTCPCSSRHLQYRADVYNKQYGHLTILREAPKKAAQKHRYFRRVWVRCVCGTEKIIRLSDVMNNHVVSCGCKTKNRFATLNRTHGKTNTPEFKAWMRMRTSVISESSTQYKRVGALGIKICERWVNSFENFLEDMGEQPAGTLLMRLDTSKDYTKDNCRWMTRTQQWETNGDLVEFRGEHKSKRRWCKHFGVCNSVVINTSRKHGVTWADGLRIVLEKRGLQVTAAA